MKKFIKRLILILIIVSCFLGIYYYKDELIKLMEDIPYKLEELGLTEKQNEIYSEAEIQEIISQTSNNVNGEYKGKLDNYYYNQLGSNARIIYRIFKDNIEILKTGTYNIRLPSILENTLKEEGGQEKLNQDFQDAWDAFKLDTPEVFYINVNKMCLMTKTITRGLKVSHELYIQNQSNENSLADGWESKEEVELSMNEIQKVKQEIVKNIPDNDFAKIVFVHNWIIDNVKYDTTTTKTNNSNIYGGLVKKEVVCEGYAKTFKYLLDELDVPCVLVCGTGTDEKGETEKHAWNYVYLNGDWYAVDTTWDDPIIIGNGKLDNNIKYKYFLKGQDDFFKNHLEEGRFTKEGIEFAYPELSVTNYRNQ